MPETGSGDLPPDLPPEYAEAYRRAYERAYKQSAGEPVDDVDPDLSPGPPSVSTATFERLRDDQGEHRISGPLFADEVGARPPLSRGGSHRADTPTVIGTRAPTYATPRERGLVEEATARTPGERPTWLVPALLMGLVVVLLIAAYGVGRVVSSSMSDAGGKTKPPSGVVMTEDGASPSAASTHHTRPAKAKTSKKPAPVAHRYRGATTSAAIGAASATCESAPSVDSGGHQVSYAPSNVHDGDMTTAWRCDGSGVGERLTLRLDGATKLGEIGLIPGYAKTDASSGADRYSENNRITKVRWTFSDGTKVVQSFDPSPSRRTMQTIRIPVVKADRVVVEVLSSERASRDTIAVSEVRLGRVS